MVPLKEARKKRDAAYALVVDGIDPIEKRKARKAEQA
ncbi:MAG: integrase arm-type DNA-binding domain-containing protein [Bradyrhizobium sp.]